MSDGSLQSDQKKNTHSKIVGIIVIIMIVAVMIGSTYFFPQSKNTDLTKVPARYTINQKGSDTLLVLAQWWAEEFMNKHPEAQIAVSGGGSGTGIAALINKQIEMADASRSIKSQEIENAKSNGVEPVEWKVTVDGIAVIIHPSNPIGGLTVTQLKGIYNGSYRNWVNVGGKDAPIITYGRQSNSGTYVYWQEHILKNEKYRTDMQALNGNSDISDAVARDPNAIGYVGVAYAAARQGEVKILPIQDKADKTFYEPTSENIANGNYPISRYLFIYTDGIPTGGVKEYLKFVISDEGQQITEEVEYIPLPSEIRQEQIDKLK